MGLLSSCRVSRLWIWLWGCCRVVGCRGCCARGAGVVVAVFLQLTGGGPWPLGITDYGRTSQRLAKWNDICIDTAMLIIIFPFRLTTYQFNLFFGLVYCFVVVRYKKIIRY